MINAPDLQFDVILNNLFYGIEHNALIPATEKGGDAISWANAIFFKSKLPRQLAQVLSQVYFDG